MKKLITFIFFSISVVTYSQEQNKIQIQIDSLKLLKNVYESKIIQIDQTIKELENSKIISAYEEYENMQYTIPKNRMVKIRDKADVSGKMIFELKNSEVITLLDLNDDGDYWLVSFNGTTGYINDVFIQQDPPILDLKKYFMAKKEQKVKEAERIALEKANEKEESRKIRAQKLEEKRKLEEAREEEILRQRRIEAVKKAQERKELLIKKYGNEIANKIISQKIWLGMTDEMARESWGIPNDINRTVGAWGVHEQWIYGDTFLYFENGVLTSWQD